MKKTLFILFAFICVSIHADTYYVEVDKITKEQKSSYILKTGDKLEALSSDRVRVEITQQEYEDISNGKTWSEDYANWLKVQANSDKIDDAIALAEG